MSAAFTIERSRAVEPLFSRAPAPPGTTPKEYQHAGVEFAAARANGNVLFGDAPGLGKTAEAILLNNARGTSYHLVVCPASLRLNWEREIWRWSTIPNVTTYPVLKAKDGVSLAHNYVIISYDLLRNPSILNALMAERWDCIIYDEAHYLKDPRGNQRTRVICAPDLLPSVAGATTLATGTLLPNQPIECYNAIRLLDHGAINGASLEDFREFYYDIGEGFVTKFDPATKKFKQTWSNRVRNVPRNLDHLQDVLRGTIMVRRLKEQVLHELPPKQWHPFPLAVTAGMREAMKHPGWQAAEKLYALDGHAFDRGVPVDGAVSTARRLLGEAKAEPVASYIEELLDAGTDKLVVSGWHHSVLDILRGRLERWGLVYMDGSTSATAKQRAVDRFQSEAGVRIILGQMMPLGEGWTLTAAQDVVFAEPDWVPGKNDQLLDRINRIGQTGGYTIGHIPVVPGSLDERILATAIEKDGYIHQALDMERDTA